MRSQPIYLDYNATTPPAREAVAKMRQFCEEDWGNPSSAHLCGQRARTAIGWARERVAIMLGTTPEQIVFTSGGTEANNHALRGVARVSPRRRLVISAIEHPAIAKVASYLATSHGVEVVVLPVDENGVVRLDVAAQRITEDTFLVSVMHANNETGVVQPVRALAELAHAKGALMHPDAAQSVGKIPVSVDKLGVDLLSLAGHKFYAPKGIGALYVRRGTPIHPFILGAGHEGGLHAGTENVPGIAALGVAAELVREFLPSDAKRLKQLRDRLERNLCNLYPHIVINGQATERLPNTTHVSFLGLSGTDRLAQTPEIAASTGSACKAGDNEPLGVMAAMGAPLERARGAIRFSLGRATRDQDIDAALAALAETLASWRQSG